MKVKIKFKTFGVTPKKETYNNFSKLTSTGDPKSNIYCENAVPPDHISDSNEVGVELKK